MKQYAKRYIKEVPISLAIRELNRLLAFEKIKDEFNLRDLHPILDVGCGDGFWWSLQPEYNPNEIYGIDISEALVKKAREHIHSELCDISLEEPFPTNKFPLIVGNCSLEHVKDIRSALNNMYRAAEKNGSKLILIVPSVDWAYQGYIQNFLLNHFPRLAMAISGALNGFFQHWHLYDASVWSMLLNQTGWEVKNIYGLGNKKSEFLFRLFLPFSFFGFIFKSIFRIYPNKFYHLIPDIIFSPIYKLLGWALKNPIVSVEDKSAYEFIIVAEKYDK